MVVANNKSNNSKNNGFRRILFLLTCFSFYCSLIVTGVQIILQSQLLFVVVVVADAAFTTTTSTYYRLPIINNKHSFIGLKGASYHQTIQYNNNNNNDKDGYGSSITLRQKRHQQQQQQQQRRTTLLLRLEATKTQTTQEEERNVGDAEETTTVAETPSIKQTKYDKQWLEQFDHLKAFWDKHGHCNVPTTQRSLYDWLTNQRFAFRHGKMRADRKALLDEIGFVWEPWEDQWQSTYEELKQYKIENGHCNVPTDASSRSLARWVIKQRLAFKEDRLPKERINLLEKIGFVWDPLDKMWQKNYKDLQEFQQLHGHVNIPREDPLSDWTARQRLDHAAGRVDADKKAMLDVLGFVWEDPASERHERQWNEMYRELVQFKLLEGHIRVPTANWKLGNWVKMQRALYRDDKLLEHRQAKLESIGFIWRLKECTGRDMTTFDKKWMKKYEELVEYKAEHGHTNVPQGKGPLGRWSLRQRVVFRQDAMRADRKRLLDEIGFEWELKKVASDEGWQAKYEELQSYKKEFGNLDVSVPKNCNLYMWIYYQRQYQQAGRLEPKRKAMLDKLGFEWQ